MKFMGKALAKEVCYCPEILKDCERMIKIPLHVCGRRVHGPGRRLDDTC